MTVFGLFPALRLQLCWGSSNERVVTALTANRSCDRWQRKVSHDHVIAPLPPDITGIWVSKRYAKSIDCRNVK